MRYDRSGYYDEIRFRSYKEIRDSYRSFLEYDHGGRNGYVWCLPYHGKTKFVCVDGPEFDAHQVDFDEMIMRLGAYKDIEKK